MFFLFDSIHDQYKTHQKSDLAVSLYPFLIVLCFDIYIPQKMGWSCWWFSSSIETYSPLVCYQLKAWNNYIYLYADENKLYLIKILSMLVFSCNKVGIFCIDLNNINLVNNSDEDDRSFIIVVSLLAWYVEF